MCEHAVIKGGAAPMPISNLDTDQIMPKQFLRGIDKAGLGQGVLYDLRYGGEGKPRTDCVLNQAAYARCKVLIGGENFGCGSSREHAVWGLMQYGIEAVVAPSFGEIFYSNAMNNRLLLAAVSGPDWKSLLADALNPPSNVISIDIQNLTIRSANSLSRFELSPRHHRMFIDGLDLVGASLVHEEAIRTFERTHWAAQPWLEGVADTVRSRHSR